MTSWVGQMFGLDTDSFSKNGVLQTTASESALIAAIAARERAVRMLLAQEGSKFKTREEIVSRMVIYGSTQTHSLGAKAGLILGIPFRALVTKKEDNWALNGETFEKAIKEDQEKGLIPFMLSELADYLALFVQALTCPSKWLRLVQQVAVLSITSQIYVQSVSFHLRACQARTLSDLYIAAKSHPEIFIHVDAAWAGVCELISACSRSQ